MLISQLMLVPLFVFCAWAYLRLSPAAGNRHKVLVFDTIVLVLCVILCAAAIAVVAGLDSGGNDQIWRPVFSTLTSFFIVPAVLTVAGLVRYFFLFPDRGSREQ